MVIANSAVRAVRATRPAALFFFWALLLGTLAWCGIKLLGDPLYVGTSWAMLTPAIAALIVLCQADTVRTVLGRARPWLQRELCPTAYAPLAIVLTFTLATAGFALTLMLGHGGPTQVVRFTQSLGSVAMLLPLYVLPALMEEAGWRGYLLDRLAHVGAARAAALTGLAWGLWHAPAIALIGFDYPAHHLLGIVAICCFTIPFGMVLAWLRRSSGTLLAPALAHATLNAMMPALAVALPHSDSLLRSPMGLLGAAPFAVVAGLLLLQRSFAARPVGLLVAEPVVVPAVA